MATKAHCAYCFETLAASFDRRPALSLAQVEELWAEYLASTGAAGTDDDGTEEVSDGADEEMTDAEEAAPTQTTTASSTKAGAKPAAISRLIGRVTKNGSSSNSTSPSSSSATSSRSNLSSGSEAGTGTATPASSVTSTRSPAIRSTDKYPLFVTWNTVSKSSGHKTLRGCIGTFEAQELGKSLRSYALTSAFEDVRFNPIPASLLPSLSAHVTLLTNFSKGTSDPHAWTLGLHGLRIAFTHGGRRLGATYLPDVAPEQGWTPEETLVSLMRKAGWSGSASSWERAWRDGRGELITYEGKQVGLGYAEWKAWRTWVDGKKR